MAGERRRGKYATTAGGLRRKVVYLPPEVEEQLRAAAYRLERTESDLLRQAIQEFLKRLDQTEA